MKSIVFILSFKSFDFKKKIDTRDNIFLCIFVIVIKGSNEPMEVFVGEVTSYTLHNLNPSTTYDVNVYAQYDSGLSVPLTDQGTTCESCSFLWL